MTILRNIISRPFDDTIRYAAGRFYSIRRLRRAFRSNGGMAPDCYSVPAVIFDEKIAYSSLAADGVYCPVRLSDGIFRELMKAVESADVVSTGTSAPGILGLDMIQNWNLQNPDSPVVLANVQSKTLPAIIEKISSDINLVRLVEKYLGGRIRRVEPRLQWSLVANASDDYREKNWQTVKFHFDVQDFDFVYAFFYLTDVDKDSGAHEMIVGSHVRKPLKFLFSSAKRDEESLREYYGSDFAFRVLEGEAGWGFIEDTSCFHRARAPVTAPRLALQIRYS